VTYDYIPSTSVSGVNYRVELGRVDSQLVNRFGVCFGTLRFVARANYEGPYYTVVCGPFTFCFVGKNSLPHTVGSPETLLCTSLVARDGVARRQNTERTGSLRYPFPWFSSHVVS
jgi:hypothetical protein